MQDQDVRHPVNNEIKSAQSAKKDLQSRILSLIVAYECEYGVSVSEIDYTRVTAGNQLVRRSVELTVTI